ncbi:MAG: hypothetical protein ACREAF_00555 [Nitrosopumilaceae archaeon]
MKSELVMQIDATVIIGVIILMTFQSFSSSAYEKQYGEVITEYRLFHAQYLANVELLKECENSTPGSCQQLHNKLREIELQRMGVEDWVTKLGIAPSFDEFFSNVTFFSIGGSLIANVINLLMVLPFATSAIVESVIALRRKDKDGTTKDEASKVGIGAMMGGFVMVVVGFSLVIYLMNCAIFVDQNCFGVNSLFEIPKLPELPTYLKP